MSCKYYTRKITKLAWSGLKWKASKTTRKAYKRFRNKAIRKGHNPKQFKGFND